MSERVFYSDCLNHCYQRTAGRGVLFYDTLDHLVFFTVYCTMAVRYRVRVFKVVQMPDHIHHSLITKSLSSLSAFCRDVTATYAKEYNRAHGRSGPLFESPFGSAAKRGDKAVRTNLLYLDNNPVTDFSSLYSLTQLEMLSIRGIGITAEQLKGLSSALPNCAIHCETAQEKVSEITLGGATFKTDAIELNLSNMGISDISALSACKELTKLDITGNSVTDLTPLMDLPNLEWLSIKDNTVSDLRPLMGLNLLRYLNAEGNGITGTAALSSMNNLNELYLAFNLISDLSGLKGLTSLRILGLESTGLTDDVLPNLYSMSSLDVLRIYDNPALSGEAVDELKANLRGCNVQHSELYYSIEIGGESFKENITELSLFGRGITDITPINRFKRLEKLDLGSNEIESVNMLQYTTAPLRELKLGNNRITDPTALMYLGSLERLDVSGNNIGIISPFKLMTSLQWLNLSNNPLDEDAIAELRAALPECEIVFDK